MMDQEGDSIMTDGNLFQDQAIKKCRSCGAPVIFIKSKRGKWMICDAEPLPASLGEVRTFEDGSVRQAKEGEIGYIDHHATCPDVKKFRKK